METIKLNGKDHEIISPEEASNRAGIYDYWELKDNEGVKIASSKKYADISEPIESFSENFDFVFLYFSDSEKNTISKKRCLIIFDQSALKGLKRKNRLAGTEENITYSKPENKRSLSEMEKASEFSTKKVNEGFEAQMTALRLEMDVNNKLNKREAELMILEERLKAEAAQAKKDLEREFERKEDIYRQQIAILEREKKELQEERDELLDLADELEDKELELEEKAKEEKDFGAQVAEAAISGLKRFAGKEMLNGLGLNGLSFPKDDEKPAEEKEEAKEPREESPRKSRFSRKREEETVNE